MNPELTTPHVFIPTDTGKCSACGHDMLVKTGGGYGSLATPEIPNRHDPIYIAAYSLQRIADGMDAFGSMDMGGMMGALFGGRGQ